MSPQFFLGQQLDAEKFNNSINALVAIEIKANALKNTKANQQRIRDAVLLFWLSITDVAGRA